ncbi:MAG: serine/threonine-protein kinase PknK, partial [Cyanobacteria bacterium P01_F01_bin.53]
MIPGITTTELIYESENSLVYRGVRDRNQQPLILKLLKQDYPTAEKLTQYKQEYKLTSALNAPNIIQAYGLERYQRTFVILLEDFGGVSLRELMATRLAAGQPGSLPFTLLECLDIFIQITDSVEAIHRADVIHKDINPANIVFNVETSQLKIIDFGLATVLPRESPLLESPRHLQGTLTHISPEQTGRMNRAVDYRTDFYSLGVTFYELLTHQLPFLSNDPMALIHCHIAKNAQPPHHVNPAIPEPLSELVMRLLAKNPEDRYQSAWGIKWDLENCREQWVTNQQILSFAVGSHDIKDRFQIPQKLYGRSASVKSLLNIFDRLSQDVLPKSELLLITGHSGIGKSSLVNEIYKPLTNCPGLFIEGKFEQLNANIPYSAIIQAFQSLVQQLLAEEESKLAHWHSELTKALAANAQVIVEVIPSLSNILGYALPSPPALPPDEAQNRFNLVFQKFIQVFAQPEHPLVIFLDDLQWADRASLKLIQNLLTVSGPQSLLLIGAYRDNEVSPTHPLSSMLEAIEESNTPIHRIQLLPLTVVDIQQLLSDTFFCSDMQSRPLAELVLSKTNGNPFFINEFLGFLYREQLIYFDDQRSLNQWQWDLSEIRKQSLTDNVIDLIVGKVKKLSVPSQETLKIAACIGHEFDLASLASVQEDSLKNIADWLSEAMVLGFIFPLNDDYKLVELEISQSIDPSQIHYKFSHDRIQDALYSLVSSAARAKIHQKVGEHLLAKSDSPDGKEKEIFDIIHHLNLGNGAVADPAQHHQLAELNLMAGKKAKKATAYALAFDYLNTGISLLPEDGWQHSYALMLEMYTETAEAAYLNLELEEMETLSHAILERSEDRIEKARTDLIRIRGYLAKNDLLAVIDIALRALKGLGLNLPQEPTQKDVLASVIKSRLFLASTSVEKLAQMPEIDEPRVITALNIFANLFISAYLSNPKLYVITIAEAFVLLVKYGNTASASTVYASYGQILCNLLGDVDNGLKLSDLAVQVSKSVGPNRYQAYTYHLVYGYLRHWKVPLQESLEPLLESCAIGKETGNIYIVAGSAFLYCLYSYCLGKDLAKLE